MGFVSFFDVGMLQAHFGLEHFVETGTGVGTSVQHARGFSFRTIRSCDIDADVLMSIDVAGDPRVHLAASPSITFLTNVIALKQGPTLWWLDAHFPGCARYVPLALEAERTEILPLEEEIRLLATTRDCSRDVIVIDDLCLYEPGPWQVDMAVLHARLPNGMRFVDEIFGPTHTIHRHMQPNGYMSALPRAAR